jgi:hypothetical protein
MAAYRDKMKQRPPAPRIKITETSGTVEVSTDHPMPSLGDALIMQAVGTVDADFYSGLLSQLINAGAHGRKPDERSLNFMLSVVKAVAPKDEVESMLAAQMAAVHIATMTFARRLAHVENLAQQDSAERAFNKLARTFAVQIEALKRYRTGGEQKVTVHHVTVNEGGQAIVGTVSQAPGGTGGLEIGRQPHERHACHALQPALHRYVETDQAEVPGAGSHRLGCLPIPWRAWWRTEGCTQWGLQARVTHVRGGGGATGGRGTTAAGKGDARRCVEILILATCTVPLVVRPSN